MLLSIEYVCVVRAAVSLYAASIAETAAVALQVIWYRRSISLAHDLARMSFSGQVRTKLKPVMVAAAMEHGCRQ
jgi:hypothetical protein